MTHTPGPWEFSIDWRRQKEWRITDAGGWLICRVNAPGESNARLIAAAPDLLLSCRELLWAVRNGRISEGETWKALIANIEAAVRKAEGGAE